MELEAQQLNLFDYASLDTDTRLFVQEKAQAIHTRLKRTAEDIIAIGLDLRAVKERLEHGQFKPWLHSEFQMSYPTAINFMRVAERFGKNINFIHLPISVLYELAAPSMPDTVIQMVEAGQLPATLSAIRDVKRELQHQPVITPILTEHDAALSGYRGYDRWQEAHKWEAKRQEVEQNITSAPVEELLVEKWQPPEQIEVRAQYLESWQQENIDDGEIEDEYRDALVAMDDEPCTEEVPIQRRGAPAALQMSESNEWYTPGQYVEAARLLMGSIDIDPASNTLANETIQAATYYDIGMNGLDKDWAGRVWLNPPYGKSEGAESNQELWSRRLIEQFQSGITIEAVLLVNANTEAKWFQPLYDYLICFTNHRIRFYNTEGTSSQPTQGNALIYFGPQKARFTELFKQFGPIVRRIA
jgi:hypothetical protein